MILLSSVFLPNAAREPVANEQGSKGLKPVPPEFTVRWRVTPHFVDTVGPINSSFKGCESHFLEAVGANPVLGKPRLHAERTEEG